MKHRLTELARKMRKEATDAERILWNHLRTKQLSNLKFRRQHPIGNYIVDFVCYEMKLIINSCIIDINIVALDIFMERVGPGKSDIIRTNVCKI